MLKISPDKILSWVAANFQYKPRKGGLELLICNPFDGDTGWNFNISTTKGTVHDWRGDEWAKVGNSKGRPTFIRFVQLYRNCSFTEAIQEVLGSSISLDAIRALLKQGKPQEEPKKVSQNGIVLPENSIKIDQSPEKMMVGIIKRWLKSRGVTDEDVIKYDIHHHGPIVVWPYYEFDELVFWQSRSAFEKIYLFPSEDCGVTKSMFLYGFDYADPGEYVVITEAIFGMMTLGEQCLASGGAGMSPRQINKLKLLVPNKGVIFAPDNDLAGISSIISNYELAAGLKYPLLYSMPPRIEMPAKPGCKPEFTKDWNEVGSIVGFKEPVRKIFENNIKRLTQQELLKLRIEIAKRRALKSA